MPEHQVQCPNCMAYVAVPILEVGMLLNCPMCHSGSRLTREMVERLKRGENVISERMPAVSDLPHIDADSLTDDGMPDAAPMGGGPGPALPPLGSLEGGTQIHAAGLTPAQLAASRRKETLRGGSEFRSRIIADYKHEKLAKLAVDVGNVGRTRGYMAFALMVIGAFLPINLMLQPSTQQLPPRMYELMPWDFASAAPEYNTDLISGEIAEARAIPADGTGWLFVAGYPLIAFLAFGAARFARFKRRPWYYLVLALLAIGVWRCNPFSGPVGKFSPMRLYDPYMNWMDTLLMIVIGVQLGMIVVLRYFHDMKPARVIVTFSTLVLVGLICAVVFTQIPHHSGGTAAGIGPAFTEYGGKAVMVSLILGALVLFPLIQIASPGITTNAMINFLMLAGLFILPMTIILGANGEHDVPSTIRHWFGIYGPTFLIAAGVAELAINKLLMAKVSLELENPKDWWAPAFQRMRLDARYNSKLIPDDEYRTEYKRLTDLMGKDGFTV